MDTLQEALFRAMLNNDWFTESDGNVESPTGYFGYVVNQIADWNDEFWSVFGDTVMAYSDQFESPETVERWKREHFCGVFTARITTTGVIHIHKVGEYVRTVGVPVMGIEVTPVVAKAKEWFRNASESFAEWDDDNYDYEGGN